MKSLKIFGFAMIVILALTSCGGKRQMAQSTHPAPLPPSLPLPNIPCYTVGNHENYYREVGICEDMDISVCRVIARNNAIKLLMSRSEELKRYISSCTLYNINMEDYTQQINYTIDDADTVCEEVYKTEAGTYRVYVAIEYSKEKVRNDIINQLNKISQDQNLGIDFSEEKFVNYLNEIIGIK